MTETNTENETVVKADTSMSPTFGALRAIQQMKVIYSGTVDPVTKQERRAKNKQARKSRRINRKRG